MELGVRLTHDDGMIRAEMRSPEIDWQTLGTFITLDEATSAVATQLYFLGDSRDLGEIRARR